MGHLNMEGVKMIADTEMVRDMKVEDRKIEQCEGCVLGKQHRESFSKV